MRTGSSSIWSAASTTPRFRPQRTPRPAAGSRSAAAPGAPRAAPSSRSQTAATPSPPQHLGRLSRAAGALAPVGWRAPRATFRRLPDPSISRKGRPCAHLHHHRPVASAAGLAAALHIQSTRGSGLRSRSRAAMPQCDSDPRPRRRGKHSSRAACAIVPWLATGLSPQVPCTESHDPCPAGHRSSAACWQSHCNHDPCPAGHRSTAACWQPRCMRYLQWPRHWSSSPH